MHSPHWSYSLALFALALYLTLWVGQVILRVWASVRPREGAPKAGNQMLEAVEILTRQSFRTLIVVGGLVFAVAYREREHATQEAMLEIARGAVQVAESSALAPLLEALKSERPEIRRGALQRICTLDFDLARQIVGGIARRDESADLRDTAERCLEIAATSGAPEARAFAQQNLDAALAEKAFRASPLLDQLRRARQLALRGEYRESAEAYLQLLKALATPEALGIASQLNPILIKRGQEEFAADNMELAEYAFRQAFVNFGD